MDKVASWKFAEDFSLEPASIAQARTRAAELGVESVTPATGALIASYAAATHAEAIVEIGTGAGVSGLWLLHGAPGATLTTIEPEIAHLDAARQAFEEAGVPSRQVRLIAKRANEVIDKLADGGYDVVFIDADADNVLDYVEHAVRLTGDVGVILVTGILNGDRTSNPAARDSATQAFRQLLATVAERADLQPVLVTVGDGVLILTKG